MITSPRNNMAGVDQVRAVGPHPHDWKEAGRDGQGEIYRECSVCGTRANVHRARHEAFRQAWLNYQEPWEPAKGEPVVKLVEQPKPPAPVVAKAVEPVKPSQGKPA